ncbi:hypothetical protein QGN32_05755 [Mycolicibacterium sp. ND9-15]|uniref:hypothetical protein n=1 Tax=Mycolicibacterium sp. ND9-15 TaxID=3042320 RepID=UPI002DDC2547|nr:hypothetical protein [Mycolicibacterium sp. ND9-15]WSE57394.1 hypothetical protein QGN32_05755 [Mycolicibacterium sp. ND9-15]
MEPVEINAGAWYLRPPRDDELIDDRPALAAMGETDPGYVPRCRALWASDNGYTWAVCEPTTGEMLAEITLDPRTALLRSRFREGYADAADIAEQSLRRFAAAALGITVA